VFNYGNYKLTGFCHTEEGLFDATYIEKRG